MYNRLQYTDNYFFKIKFVLFFIYFIVSIMTGKRPVLIYFCYQTDSEVLDNSIYSVVFLASPYYNYFYYLIVKFYMFYKVLLIFNYFFSGFGFLVFWWYIAWCSIAWLPLTFTVIGEDNLMNIYFQSEILSSPHRITAYGSVVI